MTNSLYNDPKDRPHCNELNGSFGFFQCFDSDMEPVATHIHALTTTRSVGRYSNKREGRMQTRVGFVQESYMRGNQQLISHYSAQRPVDAETVSVQPNELI